METSKQGVTLFTGICLLMAVLVIVQLWLLSATLDAVLNRAERLVIPATVASAVLFLGNAGLLLYVVAFDRQRRRNGAPRG